MPRGTKVNMLPAHLACLSLMEQVGNNWLLKKCCISFHSSQKTCTRLAFCHTCHCKFSPSSEWQVGDKVRVRRWNQWWMRARRGRGSIFRISLVWIFHVGRVMLLDSWERNSLDVGNIPAFLCLLGEPWGTHNWYVVNSGLCHCWVGCLSFLSVSCSHNYFSSPYFYSKLILKTVDIIKLKLSRLLITKLLCALGEYICSLHRYADNCVLLSVWVLEHLYKSEWLHAFSFTLTSSIETLPNLVELFFWSV